MLRSALGLKLSTAQKRPKLKDSRRCLMTWILQLLRNSLDLELRKIARDAISTLWKTLFTLLMRKAWGSVLERSTLRTGCQNAQALSQDLQRRKFHSMTQSCSLSLIKWRKRNLSRSLRVPQGHQSAELHLSERKNLCQRVTRSSDEHPHMAKEAGLATL